MALEGVIRELEKRVAGEVRFDEMTKVLYSTDASIYEIEPLGVVIPRDKGDVVATIQIAGRHGLPVLPRGAGTSLAGQACGRAIHLDLSKYLNGILEVNPEERWARIQPGVVLDELNAHLRRFGLMFAPDVSPSNRATVGGMIGNNSAGAHSILYGKTIDHVLELTAVLSDGEEIRARALTEEELAGRLRGSGLEAGAVRVRRSRGVSSQERQLGVELYNSSWTLMELPERTLEQDDQLIHHVHASMYHWLQAPECEPKHRARGEWLCSRAYAVLGRAEPALHHARRCLEICEQHAENVEDWDLAFAYEALARANRVAGDEEQAQRYEQRGRELAEQIAAPEDKEVVLKDYATL